MVRSTLKRAVSSGLLMAGAVITRHIPKVMMYHKFATLSTDPSVGSSALFEQQLIYIKALNARGHNIQITVDDGYADFYHIAYPLLKKHGVHATFFVATGFINGELWMWYDQVEYLFKQCKKDATVLKHEAWPDKSVAVTQQGCALITEFLKTVDSSLKFKLIRELADAMDVLLPQEPPEPYAPCTWPQLQEMDQSGLVTIGGHTHSHPILTQLPHAEMLQELKQSKDLLELKLGHSVDVFCYPNGTVHDYSANVISALKELGFKQAVTAFSDGFYVKDPFHLRRFGGVHSMRQFKKHVLGVEFLSKRIHGYKKGIFKATMPV